MSRVSTPFIVCLAAILVKDVSLRMNAVTIKVVRGSVPPPSVEILVIGALLTVALTPLGDHGCGALCAMHHGMYVIVSAQSV